MHKIDMDKSYVVGIDIGSSNVVMAIGTRNTDGEMSVLGVDIESVDGCVRDGDIKNFVDLGKAIEKAKLALEAESGQTINSAYVGVSGRSVYCVRYEDYVDINDKSGCVTEVEMRELYSRIEAVTSNDGDKIIERIPLRYIIDDNQKVKNPIGSFGKKLSATYLFVVIDKLQDDLIRRAMYQAGIKPCGICANPAILPHTILSDEENENGAVIIDIGSELTDISIVNDGKLWYIASLPIGASAINSDLVDFLRISKGEVETVKRKYGSAIAESVPEDITVPIKVMRQTKKQVLKRNIAEIIEERLKDIAGFVARELKAAKFVNRISCGVVLTGGSAYLANIEELFARELKMDVKLGRVLNGLDDDSQQQVSAFPQAVAMGLLLYGAQHNVCETVPDRSHVANRPRVVETPIEPVKEEMNFNFATTNSVTVEEPKAEPEVTPIAAPVVEEHTPIAPTPEVEEESVTMEREEVSDKTEPTEIIQEEQEEPKPEKPQKPKWTDRFRGFAERFRNKVDDMFTGDDYI